MSSRGSIGDDHPDGPDLIRDLVWGTALWGLEKPVEEPPEEYLWERPQHHPLATGFDQKLAAVEGREDTAIDCE